MKVKDGFMIREVAGQWVVLPLSQRVVVFNGILSLSETGAFIWRLLEKEISEEEIVQAVLEEYSIDESTARADVREFLDSIREHNLLEA